eukprot:GHVP01061615.1.p1 GENE.GHVP01061615.1~~GHVP01061615.1.p1  ORF type:complete len:102 (-),score=17.65 GHVP01061615.1:12-317(-)
MTTENKIAVISDTQEEEEADYDPASFPLLTGIPDVAFQQLSLTPKQVQQLNTRLETKAAIHRFLLNESEKIHFLPALCLEFLAFIPEPTLCLKIFGFVLFL